MIVLTGFVLVLSAYAVLLGVEIRRINIRSQEMNAAFKAYLKADLDCHWKDSAERLLKVIERE